MRPLENIISLVSRVLSFSGLKLNAKFRKELPLWPGLVSFTFSQEGKSIIKSQIRAVTPPPPYTDEEIKMILAPKMQFFRERNVEPGEVEKIFNELLEIPKKTTREIYEQSKEAYPLRKFIFLNT